MRGARVAALLFPLALGVRMAQASDLQICAGSVASEDKGADTVRAYGVELGKWMIDHSGSPAHWLGEIHQGKRLREPINIVIVDTLATTADGAKARVVGASTRAGYPIRMGHSTGYRAFIQGQPYAQLPTGWDDAFSNHLFEMTNNHGRIFGPYQHGEYYIFVGAFSREAVSLLHWPEHRYASFNKARDEYAASVDRQTDFLFTGYIDMHNAITDDPSITTGDHDGKAALLCARK